MKTGNPNDAPVLLSILATEFPSYATIRADTGLARGTISLALDRLKAEGLVSWTPGRYGTLRALVYVVGQRQMWTWSLPVAP